MLNFDSVVIDVLSAQDSAICSHLGMKPQKSLSNNWIWSDASDLSLRFHTRLFAISISITSSTMSCVKLPLYPFDRPASRTPARTGILRNDPARRAWPPGKNISRKRWGRCSPFTFDIASAVEVDKGVACCYIITGSHCEWVSEKRKSNQGWFDSPRLRDTLKPSLATAAALVTTSSHSRLQWFCGKTCLTLTKTWIQEFTESIFFYLPYRWWAWCNPLSIPGTPTCRPAWEGIVFSS